ncbi:TniQ family protein [Streptomyces sp. SA15]|uniref:TniQ family protein n=1 Tax=Streptomyces sp. SA15 TaxID=934019 RepID=UPI000D1BB157|nr:TniQ family protein [Streptomyces sp. SA15]
MRVIERRLTTRKPLRSADLPIRVPLIHGETTASYLARTAAANGIEAGRLLKALHQGRLPSGALAPLRPHLKEVRLSPESVTRLAALVERDEDQLRRALPGLRPGGLLVVSGAEVRLTVWPDGPGEGPLKACPLCLEDGAWLIAAGHRWRPCACGRRWQCGDDAGYLIDTTPLPEIGRALQQHRAFDHRWGPAGDALVADAHQVTLWWWVSKQFARDLWHQREEALGVGPRLRRRQAAPAVVYPEAVRLAAAMADWETRRAASADASARDWLADVADRFKAPGIVDGRESQPLRYWLELHHSQPARPAPRGTKRAERRWNLLPGLHHRPAERGPFQANSCLRWVYGLPLTSVTEICPYCGASAPTCRWVPFPDCPERPTEDQHR